MRQILECVDISLSDEKENDIDLDGELKALILATGGYGAIELYSNPERMAYRKLSAPLPGITEWEYNTTIQDQNPSLRKLLQRSGVR